MSANILITGANGFLGKHVQTEFARKYMDNILTPNSMQLDLTNRTDVLDYFNEYKPTKVLHMAALCGGILANKNSPADFIHVNIQMTCNIFEAVKKYKVKYLYTLSSVCAYPENTPVPFKEDNIWNGYPEPTNAPYGIAKRLQMSMQEAYRKQYGLKGVCFIPVNLYGPEDHFNLTNSHVIPALVRKFVEAKYFNRPEVKCWGSGNAYREFLYAENCAEALANAVLRNFDRELPINLGTGQDISIKELAHLIAKLTQYEGNIVFSGDESIDGQKSRRLDVSRAAMFLGWYAKTDLITGLIKTIEWYKNKTMKWNDLKNQYDYLPLDN